MNSFEPSLSITTNLLSGQKVAVTLESENVEKNYCMQNKLVFFLCDVSASMFDTLPSVKASLFAFRDLICGNTKRAISPTDKEFISILPNFYIATFSDTARIIWSSKMTDQQASFSKLESLGNKFSEAVNSIEVEESTNMGAGIDLAFELFQGENKAKWLIILTDGESNKGNYQTEEGFEKLVKTAPKNTKIITLGYGDDFNAKNLNSIGDFTYLKDRESISGFMGALTHEISTCSIFDVNVKLNPGDSVPEYELDFGTLNIGNFFNERKYSFGLLPSNSLLSQTSEDFRYHDESNIGAFTYFKITEAGLTEQSQLFSSKGFPTEPTTCQKLARIRYYASVYIKNLFICPKKRLHSQIGITRWAIKGWDLHDYSIESKETVERICSELLEAKKSGKVAKLGFNEMNSLRNQTSYTDAKFASPSSAKAYRQAIDLSKKYIKM